MDVQPSDVSQGIQQGIAAGVGTALVGFLGGLVTGIRRAKRKQLATAKELHELSEWLAALEKQMEQNRAFQRAQITFQLGQIEAFEAIINVGSRSCEDCPMMHPEDDGSKARESVAASKQALMGYLASLA